MDRYTLCHKDIPVLDCEFDGDYLVNISAAREISHVPVGCIGADGDVNSGLLREWWRSRQVPVTRSNIKDIASSLGISNTESLSMRNFGCCLSDQYWMKPYGSDLGYRDVNFFENDFEPDLSRIFLSSDYVGRYESGVGFVTPSCSTGGDVPKAWVIDNKTGERALYKSSGTAFGQEPYNEIIASKSCDALGVGHVPYKIAEYEGIICSMCPCMINPNQDIVPAYMIIKDNGRISLGPESDIIYYKRFAKEHGIKDIDKQIGAMVAADFLMRNTDRHWNNFGLIRDARTLEYIKFVPLFDFGNSLYHNHAHIDLRSRAASKFSGADLFRDLKYARGNNCPDISKIGDFPDIVRKTLRNADMDGDRKNKLISFAEYQTERLINYLDDEYQEQLAADSDREFE